MNKNLFALAVVAALGLCTQTSIASAKTVKECTEEWRANKADNQAKGIKLDDYVEKCRAGTAAAPTPAPATAAPKAAAPAPAEKKAAAPDKKTVKECTEEWRANKADNQAKGIKLDDYVEKCRAGGTAAAAPAPATPPAASTPPAAAAPKNATAPKSTSAPETTGALGNTGAAGANQFTTEAQAKAKCPTDTVVWVNTESKIYHFAGYKNYGNTKSGVYMCEKDTAAQGMRAAKNQKHP